MDGERSPRLTDAAQPVLVPKHIRRALAHMRASLSDRMTLADLAAAGGISARGLLRAFERFLGVSPMTHLLRMRLAAARAELLRCDSALSVAEVAGRCGLPHLGRFAADYRKAFGELPSATVRRARQAAGARDGATSPVSQATMAADLPSLPAPLVTRPCPPLILLPLRTETVGERHAAQEVMEQLAAMLSHTSAASVTFADPSAILARQLAWAPKTHSAPRYCLHGRLVQRDNRTRITLWLTDAEGRHVWGDSYDGVSSALFDLSRHVVDRALCGIVPAITGAEIARLGEKDPQSLAARDMLVRALPLLMKLDAASARRALAIATRAMEIDPDDALAPAFSAYCHLRLFSDGAATSPLATREEMLRLARRAAALDTGDPLVATALASIATLFQPPEEAEALVERALAMDPTSSWAWERKGFLHWLDRPDLALACFDRAMRLRGPRMPRENILVGIFHSHGGSRRPDQAARFARLTLAENPDAMLCHRFLVCYEWQLGHSSAARQSADALRRAHPHFSTSALSESLARPMPSACFDALIAAGVPP